ncbi:hypothetical protein I546_2463 [Mycobacterium kansasii 732]|nr:hypothetical protein I546_2463 [Mycobacterium kansasii 732]
MIAHSPSNFDTNFSAQMKISLVRGIPATVVAGVSMMPGGSLAHGTAGGGGGTAYLVPVTNSIAYRNAIETLGDRRRP